jgi:hypothetical protein
MSLSTREKGAILKLTKGCRDFLKYCDSLMSCDKCIFQYMHIEGTHQETCPAYVIESIEHDMTEMLNKYDIGRKWREYDRGY